MSSCLPMDVLGVTKSILSGDDSHSWIQSILMSEDDKKKLLHDIDKLAQVLLNDQEKIRLHNLIHSKTKSMIPFFEVNNTLARNSLQTSSKKLVESYVFNGELNFDSLEYISGKMILNYEFDRVISSLITQSAGNKCVPRAKALLYKTLAVANNSVKKSLYIKWHRARTHILLPEI